MRRYNAPACGALHWRIVRFEAHRPAFRRSDRS